ncbi:MAG: glucose-6-phosphate isomerase [Anaerolineae bacterium]
MKTPRQQLFLGNFDLAVEARLHAWAEEEVGRRIWEKDGTIWVADPAEAANTPELTNRMGWLALPKAMRSQVDSLTAFATQIREAAFKDVVLLGMGGSSLAPDVMMSIFGNAPGFPPLTVLDSTNPQAVQTVAEKIKAAETLFLVSSKSGGTVETLSFFKYFFDIVSREKPAAPGQNFVAITDPGSGLEKLAAEHGFWRVFPSPPEVGGRYSALTYFGLVPAALIGLDLPALLKRAQTMADACGPNAPVTHNPGLLLGAAIGELALAARDKLTFFASPAIARFPVWLEQLIAESTGKRKTGILPVTGESPAPPARYGSDRVFVYLRLNGDTNEALDRGVEALKAAGQPLIQIDLPTPLDLAQEFFRWEFATAAAGSVLGINPFNQPNVEAAKANARHLMTVYRDTGQLPTASPLLAEGDIEVYGKLEPAASVAEQMAAFLTQAGAGDYLAVMAYIPPSEGADAALKTLQTRLRNRLNVAVTVGYGPHFLHSTGQLHKGDSNKGVFLQLTHTPATDFPVPGEPYSFGTLISAQAQGDFQALVERGRRVIRFHVRGDVAAGLERLAELV